MPHRKPQVLRNELKLEVPKLVPCSHAMQEAAKVDKNIQNQKSEDDAVAKFYEKIDTLIGRGIIANGSDLMIRAPRDNKGHFLNVGGNSKRNKALDATRIAIATQAWNLGYGLLCAMLCIARVILLVFTLGFYRLDTANFSKKYAYMQPDEDPYAHNSTVESWRDIQRRRSDEENFYVSAGHASILQFVHINDGKYLVLSYDAVHGDLNPIFYREQTKSLIGDVNYDLLVTDPNITMVGLVSHAHRDHMLSKKGFQKIIENGGATISQPGSSYAFPQSDRCITQEWSECTVIKDANDTAVAHIMSLQNDHWSGMGLFDQTRSSHSGFLVLTKDHNLTFNLGDTAALNDATITDHAIKACEMLVRDPTAKITVIVPGGPNYPRNVMESTHMSFFDAVLYTKKLTNIIQDIAKKCEIQSMAAEAIKTMQLVLHHHNKYKLGTDRHDEERYMLEICDGVTREILTEIDSQENTKTSLTGCYGSRYSYSKFDDLINRMVATDPENAFVYKGFRDTCDEFTKDHNDDGGECNFKKAIGACMHYMRSFHSPRIGAVYGHAELCQVDAPSSIKELFKLPASGLSGMQHDGDIGAEARHGTTSIGVYRTS